MSEAIAQPLTKFNKVNYYFMASNLLNKLIKIDFENNF